ncbi:hypothetical protein B0H16DRAFT_1463551 [Mycena metata]|uniref:Uncharacterized protein n=1 Tax=Mycena metata TaxID=1033252 RepID=A0AAD7IHX6_9AGAR|nr:hypothetical protein B0H16DRAFT_1463551 [Mycena metata]
MTVEIYNETKCGKLPEEKGQQNNYHKRSRTSDGGIPRRTGHPTRTGVNSATCQTAVFDRSTSSLLHVEDTTFSTRPTSNILQTFLPLLRRALHSSLHCPFFPLHQQNVSALLAKAQGVLNGQLGSTTEGTVQTSNENEDTAPHGSLTAPSLGFPGDHFEAVTPWSKQVLSVGVNSRGSIGQQRECEVDFREVNYPCFELTWYRRRVDKREENMNGRKGLTTRFEKQVNILERNATK